MDSIEGLDDVDLTLRHVSRQFPEQFARALLPGATTLSTTGWLDTQITGRQRRLDRALDVEVDGHRRLLHAEWQLAMEAEVPLRVFEYHVLLALGLADVASATQPAPPIESVVVLLSGREEPWPTYAEYRSSPPGLPFSGVCFRIDAVYQRTIAELAARESPLWLIFAPLAVDADGAGIARMIEELRTRTPARDFEELSVAMTVIADADKRKRGLRGIIVSLLKEEIIMESWVYRQGMEKGLEQGLEKGVEQGVEKGVEKGIQPFARMIARKLGRELTGPEHRILLQRVDLLDPDRLLDLAIELSPEDLTAWLATPDAQ
jgi:hypothetical protein